MNRLPGHLRAMAQLAPSSGRLVPWWHLAAGSVLALVPVWLSWRGAVATPGYSVSMLRLAMLPLALSAAFALDDPTLNSTSHAPLPVAGRLAVRLALILPVIAVVWTGLAGFAAAAPGLASSTRAGWELLPLGALSLELGALVALTLAAGRLAARWLSIDEGGLAGGPVTLATAFALYFLAPPGWAFYLPYRPDPAGQATQWPTDWTSAHQRWAALAAAAALVLGWCSRDPGRFGVRLSGRLSGFGNRIAPSTRQPHDTARQEAP